MSFGFLPTPIYITMVLCVSIVLLIYFIKYYKAGKILQSMPLILSFIISLLVALAKIIQEFFMEYEEYVSILVVIGGILFVFNIIFIGIAGWQNSKMDPQKRKLFNLFLFFMIGLIIFATVTIGGLFYLKAKGYF
ncbi:hypothetical protein HZI73_04245 [Vallitalea pronyensis]|uniref:Uncharacterized protein n=1 Tax=Vallitalea pronyensis TaxID=1348613 RepID=A0A8J8SFG2_9FIRM|nr:hypothetical protein [Vallitalea pronyensis]QUI21551.1 hypothetical protein HZI73_04245 [Vallitalea pronyensis]